MLPEAVRHQDDAAISLEDLRFVAARGTASPLGIWRLHSIALALPPGKNNYAAPNRGSPLIRGGERAPGLSMRNSTAEESS